MPLAVASLARLCVALILVSGVCAQAQPRKESEGKSQNQQPPANQQTPTPQPQATPIQVPVEQPKADDAGKERQEQEEKPKGWFTPEWAAAITNALVLILIGFQTAIYWRQLNLMREMHRVSKRQHRVMRNQEGIMQGQLDTMNAQADVMRETVDVMRETLAETKRVFDLTERPIVVVEAAGIPDFAPNQRIRPMITLVNKGRTAAKNLSVSFKIADPGVIYCTYPQGTEFPVSILFLAAGDSISIMAAPAEAITFDDEVFNSIAKGRAGLMIYGRGSYEDMAGKEYLLDEYAFRYHAQAKGFAPDYYSPPSWGRNKALLDAAEEENPN